MTIALFVFGIFFVMAIGMYNSLIRLKNNVKKSFAGIEVGTSIAKYLN